MHEIEQLEAKGRVLGEQVRQWVLAYYGICECDGEGHDTCGACLAWRGYRDLFGRLEE